MSINGGPVPSSFRSNPSAAIAIPKARSSAAAPYDPSASRQMSAVRFSPAKQPGKKEESKKTGRDSPAGRNVELAVKKVWSPSSSAATPAAASAAAVSSPSFRPIQSQQQPSSGSGSPAFRFERSAAASQPMAISKRSPALLPQPRPPQEDSEDIPELLIGAPAGSSVSPIKSMLENSRSVGAAYIRPGTPMQPSAAALTVHIPRSVFTAISDARIDIERLTLVRVPDSPGIKST